MRRRRYDGQEINFSKVSERRRAFLVWLRVVLDDDQNDRAAYGDVDGRSAVPKIGVRAKLLWPVQFRLPEWQIGHSTTTVRTNGSCYHVSNLRARHIHCTLVKRKMNCALFSIWRPYICGLNKGVCGRCISILRL